MRWNGRGMDREDAERKTGKKHHFLGVLRRPSLPPGTQPFGKYGQNWQQACQQVDRGRRKKREKEKGGDAHNSESGHSLSFLQPFSSFYNRVLYTRNFHLSLVWEERGEGGGGSTSSFLSCLPARMQKDSTFRQLISHFCIVFEKGGGRDGRSRRRGGGRSSQTRDFCIV